MIAYYELTVEEQIAMYLKETGSKFVDLNKLILFAYSKVEEE